MNLTDLRIIVDTAEKLVVQTKPDGGGLWVMALIVFGVIGLAGWRLWSRSRALAVAILVMAVTLFGWTALSLTRTGGVVDEFVMDRAANQFVVDSFYPRNHAPESKPVVRPLDQVLRADVEQGRNGATLVVTLKSGDKVYPLGHVARHVTNEFLLVDRMGRMLR